MSYTLFSEVNVTSFHGRGCGRGHVHDKKSYKSHAGHMDIALYHKNWNNIKTKQEKGKGLKNKPSKNHEETCYRCGIKGHWSHTCCTPELLIDLYQASIKDKGKKDIDEFYRLP